VRENDLLREIWRVVFSKDVVVIEHCKQGIIVQEEGTDSEEIETEKCCQ